MNETWADCAIREVKEETNLDINNLTYLHTTNDPNISGNINKHYITIFMTGKITDDSKELINLEPEKCISWNWFTWNEILNIYNNINNINNYKLFDPVVHFIEDGKTPINL